IYKFIYNKEPLSKRFSLVKVKAGENFNRRNTWSISRIKTFAQRRDRPKWDVLKLALKSTDFAKVLLLSTEGYKYAYVLSFRAKREILN
ncbi:MAG: hypothetical protein KKA35_01005, partial [Proteobacteria bacterium]|nr:hypothetical protein [Pseudomonadota bacterium]